MEQSKFYQIKNVTEHEYTLVGCDGSVITRPIQDVDKTASVFTIQDANDGDVLATKTGGVFIYKELLYDKPFAYCGVDKFGVFKDCNCGDGLDWTPYLSEVTPATKEQRDLLFQKMKEAGYEWSDKDKKLIKTEEQNEEISEELKAASILHSELVRNQSCIDEDFIDGATWLKRQIAWSEEDEKMLKSAIGAVGAADYYTYDDKQEIEEWLESLKERLKGK